MSIDLDVFDIEAALILQLTVRCPESGTARLRSAKNVYHVGDLC